jgi:predicted phosphodiesterase
MSAGTMTRVALISDIHANAVALRAVLEDIRRIGVDQIVCLGDVADLGPQPNAVIEIVAELGCPCIMGNHDAFMLNPALVHSYSPSPVLVDSADWTRSRLSASEIEFLRGFEPEREIALDGDATLHIFHGSPRSHMEDILATTPPEALDEMLAGRAATVMAGGHTHVQMLRQHHGHLLVNPGSVGLAFKDYVHGGSPTILSHAEYAIVTAAADGVEVSLRRMPLDRDELRAAQSSGRHPLSDFLLRQYS